MTPEQDLEQLVRSVCPDSGHWPYTRDSDLYIGFRPSDDGPFEYAAGRPVRTDVTYDLVVCAVRNRLPDAERLRYVLYNALRSGGWTLDGEPGPETFNRQTGLYMWPLSARKGFRFDADGVPQTIGG